MPPMKGGIDIVRQARDTDLPLARASQVPVVRADVTGRADGLVCYGASGLVDRHGTVLRAPTPIEVELVVAEIGTIRL